MVWDVHMHVHKALKMWMEPRVGRGKRYRPEPGPYTSLGFGTEN